ncbi:curli production assembly/transport protein CsgE [Kaistella sp. BT6-1-3]|uniref:Curli production assembly/transport component CsgE n=1 Tax=Kaistella yananensis TaxID=2989820 RepID=A0ABT3JNG3_9FLAO|nr:curli production assembly/transport protein CsgE [Kaistella yananensis]MCW4452323.1 curli production assembly/transport protein CsgE [Kaistella yananensis]
MKILTPIFFFLLVCSIQQIKAQQEKSEISSKIESNFIEGQLTLKATASNHTTAYRELNYLFVSIKKSKSGNLSNNKQSGKFTLKPDESKTLSQMSVNIQKNDALKVFLFIKEEETDKPVSKDSLEINANMFQDKIKNINENEIFELKGITIDQTKTKAGKDFYDLFYLEYSKLPEKISSVITIDETPTMGRGSQISIGLEDRTLYSFIANPSEDYLSEQATLSVKIILDYNRKKSLIRNEFRY